MKREPREKEKRIGAPARAHVFIGIHDAIVRRNIRETFLRAATGANEFLFLPSRKEEDTYT